MRKDVRLALAVGTVLVFAVLVYALFFTGPVNKKTSPTNPGGAGTGTVAQNNNGSSSTGGATSPAPITEYRPTPVRPPEVTVTPDTTSTGPATRPADVPGTTVVITPTPAPTPAPTPIASGETFDWGGALHHGLPAGGTERAGATGGTTSFAPVAPTTSGARKYQVKPNETLWAIARTEYGNAAYVNHIIRANPGIDANRLRAGTTILLPEKTQVVPETGPARLATAGPTTRPIDPTTQYRVQSGDNLFTIAKKLYGNINRAGKLYEANKDLIGPNPNALKLNMVLRLPDPPTPAATTATPSATARPEITSPAISDLR